MSPSWVMPSKLLPVMAVSVVRKALGVAGLVLSKTVLAKFNVVTLLSVPLSVISVRVTTRLPLMPSAMTCR